MTAWRAHLSNRNILQTMKVYINGEAADMADGATVADVLAAKGISPTGTAVAVENRVVPRAEWAARILTEGAKLTVIRAVCGG